MNLLPDYMKSADTIVTFKSHLKTCLPIDIYYDVSFILYSVHVYMRSLDHVQWNLISKPSQIDCYNFNITNTISI